MLAALPLIAVVPGVNANYWLHNFILVVMWTIIGMSWNLLSGYCGQVSFGHAAFFGIGAYTSGLLYAKFGWSAWWGLLASIPVVAAAALVIGFICLRLRGPFFALATIAVGVILRIVAENLVGFTGGDQGIMIRERTWVEKTWYFYIILGLAAATFWFVHRIVASRLGYYFVAIREDQDAAHSLGINLTLHKSIALAISAALTAAAGSVFALYVRFIDPNIVFSLPDVSVQMVLICIIGGIGTILGPVIGSVVMVLLGETLRNPKWLVQVGVLGDESVIVAFIEQRFSNAHVLVYGILVVVVILFAPDGILGLLRTWWQRARRRLAKPAAA